MSSSDVRVRTAILRDQQEFREDLIERGILIKTDVAGVYGRSASYEEVISGLNELITSFGRDRNTEVMRFPPVMSRKAFERSGFLKSFPQLAGSVHVFHGDHHQHAALLEQVEAGLDWEHHQAMTDVVLTPAACYPVYPTLAGTLPASGRSVDVRSYCFRHEPDDDPARMQSFRMREFVRLAEAQEVVLWRDLWLERGQEMLSLVGLEPTLAPAADPFFGPGARMLAASQREQSLKFELLVPVSSDSRPSPVLSVNYHQDLFGECFGIRTSEGAVAHTSCVGIGMERIALALFRKHGFVIDRWPSNIRGRLWT